MDQAHRALYETFGGLIRRKRRALDLTQGQLSQRLGISRGALANIETGRQNILLHQLYSFAAALEMNVIDLLPRIEASAPDALPLPKDLTTAQKGQIARLFDQGPTTTEKATK